MSVNHQPATAVIVRQFGRFIEERWATRLALRLCDKFTFVRVDVSREPWTQQSGCGRYYIQVTCTTKQEMRQVDAFCCGWLSAHEFARDIVASQWENKIQ